MGCTEIFDIFRMGTHCIVLMSSQLDRLERKSLSGMNEQVSNPSWSSFSVTRLQRRSEVVPEAHETSNKLLTFSPRCGNKWYPVASTASRANSRPAASHKCLF